ncbi:hypothetical protein CSV71_12900 [Sporosarcina sp. P21c]|uniref:hypothetical protein n=1 Tax=unclassified Sporosarcina TaxID=2647733 RepID=UPI000C16412A|nr:MULTISPECIES: hypothetical protein [unclassified Sporosarcina]PIC66164.1 hypothetical protein CSV78_13960 [Sporosarcina sp. P16a]PIC88805.1 hypothetical protein CSV71_12900 [Sporosarcina sp. P21c]PIC91828.1 hypothetical protein CSV70_13630 [Sporosarcina sp. P25]
MKKNRERFTVKGIGIVVALLISVGAFTLMNYVTSDSTTDNQDPLMDNENGSVEIPAIQLPKDSSNADMVGLIVYNGKIYTQTNSEIHATDAKALIGDKLGTTKGSIDEWSKQKAYDEELASTIGEMDVYSVKGYDKDFRLMVYEGQAGNQYAEFYECLNGITISSGEDVFGKLHLVGNVSTAQWRAFSDWDHDIDNYKPILDMNVLNTFLEELKKTKPHLREQNSDPISGSRNDEEFRELTLALHDGSTVTLTLLKDGYIYYGNTDVYFEMNESMFSKLWNLLK